MLAAAAVLVSAMEVVVEEVTVAVAIGVEVENPTTLLPSTVSAQSGLFLVDGDQELLLIPNFLSRF